MIRSRQHVSRSEVVCSNGIVTAMHPLAAEAGVAVLQAGGNAADAAVATGFAIGVVEPFMNGIGGCSYALSYESRGGETICIDGSTVAPDASREDMFDLVPGDEKSAGLYGWRATRDDAHETGYRSIAVPGTVAALGELHARHASLPWRELLAPAIELAEGGFAVDEYFFAHSAASAARLRPYPESMGVYFRADGTPWCPSFPPSAPQTFRQPELADTLRSIADEGASSFYTGGVARTIVTWLQDHGGILQTSDFERFRAQVLPPLDIDYRGRRLACLPIPSGGPTVALALGLLAGFDLPSLQRDGAEHAHLVAEALRAAFSYRFRYLGDPDTIAVPTTAFASERYLTACRARIAAGGVSPPEPALADPWEFEPSGRARPSTDGRSDSNHQHTTHVNVVDKDRNMVALTATLGGRFGSGVTVPGTGVVLNNGMMWYDPEPGRPSSILPGKRALHAAAPCLVFDADKPLAALGSPGGRMIMSAVVQLLVHVLDHGMSMQEAIEAPRLHREASLVLRVDDRFPQASISELARRGHDVLEVRESFLSGHFGRPSGIVVNHGSGTVASGVEPYRISAAAGY